MNTFIRHIEPKVVLNTGFLAELETLVKETGKYNFYDYDQVWEWAEKYKDERVYAFIVGLNGTPWVGGEIINVSAYNNELLWRAIEKGNVAAVKALLKVPNLFREEIFTLELGTSPLKDEFVYRGPHKFPVRATNFGAFVHLAGYYMYENKPNKEIEKMLLKYYKKWKDFKEI